MMSTYLVNCDVCGNQIESYKTVVEGRAKFKYCAECFATLERILRAHHWPMKKDEEWRITILPEDDERK